MTNKDNDVNDNGTIVDEGLVSSTCQFCGVTFGSGSELSLHYKEKHPERIGEEAGRDFEDTTDKLKAGAKAIASKLEDPGRDLTAEYAKKKAEEGV